MPRSWWTRSARVFGVVALGGAAMACSPSPDRPVVDDPPESCVVTQPPGGGIASRDLAVGQGAGADFVAYANGDSVFVVAGFQGGYMLTPSLRVAADGDTEGTRCFPVVLRNSITGGVDVPDEMNLELSFTRHGDAFYVERINDLLSFELDPLLGQTLTLDITVSGPTFEATSTVSLLLE